MIIKKILCILLAVTVLLTAAGCAQEDDGPSKKPVAVPENTEGQTQVTTQAPEETVPLNPYGPLDFAYEGENMVCLAGESMTGIDVSAWQGEIDWQKVADSGIEFVIIRMAWRGTDQGALYADECAKQNYEGAKAAGLKVGGYVFSQAIRPEEAVEEAEFLLDMVKDWDIEMPLILDWEYINEEARTANVDARTLTDCYIAFCDTVNAAGYESMVYFNPEQSWNRLYLEELTDYEFWLAMYDSAMIYPYRVHMWQYTDSGTVPGIEGPVDMNIYLEYEE